MQIRRFEHHEWTIYRDLRISALKDSPDAFCATLDRALQLPDSGWRTRITHCDGQRNYPILAISHTDPCGLGWAMLDDEQHDKAHLYQLWIAPDYRRLGLAQRIIESAIEWARRVNANDLTLGIIMGNSGAEKLYRSLGFVKTGEPVPVDGRDGLLTQDMVLNLKPLQD